MISYFKTWGLSVFGVAIMLFVVLVGTGHLGLSVSNSKAADNNITTSQSPTSTTGTPWESEF